MNLLHRGNRRSEHGQIIPLFALFLVVLILFLGLAIDFGFAYLTKARLSKAVDAAALAGMRNRSLGQSQAASAARSAFDANYGTPGNPPAVNIAFSTGASGNVVLSVSATATLNTFFIRILPQWQTLDIHASAQATRPSLIMSLVLDRSGSMDGNGGANALPGAVSTFVDLFDDNNDQMAMISFSSAARVEVPMRTGFQDPIKNAVNTMNFSGGTFSQGGLALGLAENAAVTADESAIKVVVFFTDGLANILQDTLACKGFPTLRNFGGYDHPQELVGLFDPRNGGQICHIRPGDDPLPANCQCDGVIQFRAQFDDRFHSFERVWTTTDAEYRAVHTARQMRAQGMVVYSIGLGSNINRAFLQEVANDPASPRFDPNQPVGEAVFAPAASDLQDVFQTIAGKILVRLSQ